MKKNISIFATLFLLLMFLMSSTKSFAQDTLKSDFVVMTAFIPASTTFYSPSLIISYGNGKTESIPLREFTNTKKITENAETLNKYFNRFKREGYKLKTATGGDLTTTYIFEKD